MPSSEKRLHLDLNVTQLRFLNVAIETVSRLANGQWSDAFVYTTSPSGKMVYPHELSDIVEPKIRPLMGLSLNASFGVGKREDTDALWDMYTTIRHRLAWDKARQDKLVNDDGSRNWSHMLSNQYDSPTRHGPYEPIEVVALDEQGGTYRLSFEAAQGDLMRGALATMHELSQGKMTRALRWVEGRDGQPVYTRDLDNALTSFVATHLQWLENNTSENRSFINMKPPFEDIGIILDKAYPEISTDKRKPRPFDAQEPGL